MSYMLNKKTNVTIRFRRERNVWILDAYVDKPDAIETIQGQSFHRWG